MKKIKRLFRSGNIGFSFFRNPRGRRSSIRYNNRAFFYRRGMVDTVIMERILFLGKRCEYRLPTRLNPSFILDLGSNIGASVVYFKKCWPAARIVAVEPAAANYALLCDNTRSYDGIQCLGCAVGGTSGRGAPVDRNTPNISPYRISQDGSGEVDILSFADLPLGEQPVDLIKIDIEGQEYDFLRSIPEQKLRRIKWIVGEIHGVDDWKLFDHLSNYFILDTRKTLDNRTAKFHACNKEIYEDVTRGFSIKLLQH